MLLVLLVLSLLLLLLLLFAPFVLSLSFTIFHCPFAVFHRRLCPGMASTQLDVSENSLRLLATAAAVGPVACWDFELALAFGCRVDLGAVNAR